MDALKIAATGMMAQEQNVNVISNNIANVNTTAYKRQRVSFQDLMYINKVNPGATTSNTGTVAPTGVQSGLGVRVGSTYKVFTQGTMNRTDAPLDMSIQGRGFFRITLPDGTEAFTRDGSFEQNETGQLVTKNGYELNPGITIPTNATQLNISDDGVVSVKVDDQIQELGNITISMFQNEVGLENIGDNLYLKTVASGSPVDATPGKDGSGTLLQYHLEGSNVSAIEGVTDLISAQRAYEMNSRIITTVDQMMNAINQMR